ncbi:hypothetical protein EYF80_005430 [Liparis tanakae]|uniref:Uncharacterized protein n=1 Tax=Liparis tanakae TaxID=230148 RepID=A0A4Z2J348_9TELE|nr:hypothetical protein EYF80_005430 [Liparis tanakae]
MKPLAARLRRRVLLRANLAAQRERRIHYQHEGSCASVPPLRSNRRVLVVSPVSPTLPTDGLSVDDLDPSSPAELRAAGGAPMPLGGGFS